MISRPHSMARRGRGCRSGVGGWLCLGPANGKCCLIITRSGFENMLRSASQPAPAVTLPKQVEPTPEMQARLAAICAENGIDLIGPPID